jgi:hypothetical protein
MTFWIRSACTAQRFGAVGSTAASLKCAKCRSPAGCPDEFVDRLTDTSAIVLRLFGRALAKIPCRIEHLLAKR